ncbi:hypothetical protein ACWD4V_13255 [Streptomyces tsukubensis]
MPYGWISVAFFAAWLGPKLINALVALLHDLATNHRFESGRRATARFLWLSRPGEEGQPIQGWVDLTWSFTMAVVLITPFWWVMKHRQARGAVLRHQATTRAVAALKLCAEAYNQQPGQRSAQLRDLDRSLRAVEGAIFHAHRHAGTIPLRSTRRAAARTHAARVAGALRAEALRIDAEPDVALPRLGVMLTTIGERCAEGRIGAMLPEESLVDVVPVSATRTAIRESVHVAVVILAAMAAAVGASAVLPSLEANSGLRTALIVGCAVLAAIFVGGWHRVGRILEVVPGK